VCSYRIGCRGIHDPERAQLHRLPLLLRMSRRPSQRARSGAWLGSPWAPLARRWQARAHPPLPRAARRPRQSSPPAPREPSANLHRRPMLRHPVLYRSSTELIVCLSSLLSRRDSGASMPTSLTLRPCGGPIELWTSSLPESVLHAARCCLSAARMLPEASHARGVRETLSPFHRSVVAPTRVSECLPRAAWQMHGYPCAGRSASLHRMTSGQRRCAADSLVAGRIPSVL
jgi:hypothetical protein